MISKFILSIFIEDIVLHVIRPLTTHNIQSHNN